MTTDELDPLIHVPTRLKIVATLAALPDGDTLSFTRLQDMIGLTPGNLIIHLRKRPQLIRDHSHSTSLPPTRHTRPPARKPASKTSTHHPEPSTRFRSNHMGFVRSEEQNHQPPATTHHPRRAKPAPPRPEIEIFNPAHRNVPLGALPQRVGQCTIESCESIHPFGD